MIPVRISELFDALANDGVFLLKYSETNERQLHPNGEGMLPKKLHQALPDVRWSLPPSTIPGEKKTETVLSIRQACALTAKGYR